MSINDSAIIILLELLIVNLKMMYYIRENPRRSYMSDFNPSTQLIGELALINCRDLGGMPLSGGRTFRKGIFIRSGSPEWLNHNEFLAVKKYGVTTVVDLRATAELEEFGNPFKDDPDTDFFSIPLFVGNPNDLNDKTMDYLRTHHLGDYYVIIMEELGDQVCQVLRVLLNSQGITFFHCAHGKDRTGVIAACLYLLAKASREDIINNYKVSFDYLGHFLDPLMARTSDDMKHTLRSDAINMEIFLNYIDSKWNGDIRLFMKSNGMTDVEIGSLYSKCIGES